MSVSVDLTFDQVAQAVRKLSPGERETLAILLDAPLRRKLQTRRKALVTERKQRRLLGESDLFDSNRK